MRQWLTLLRCPAVCPLCLFEPAAQGLFNDSLISLPVMPLNDTEAVLIVMTSLPTTDVSVSEGNGAVVSPVIYHSES